jgi:hypothetical protein
MHVPRQLPVLLCCRNGCSCCCRCYRRCNAREQHQGPSSTSFAYGPVVEVGSQMSTQNPPTCDMASLAGVGLAGRCRYEQRRKGGGGVTDDMMT